MKSILLSLFLLTQLFGAADIIKIGDALDEVSKEYLVKYFLNGSVYLDYKNVYVCSKNRLYIQSRADPNSNTTLEVKINGSDKFILKHVYVKPERYYFLLIADNGRIYLYSIDKNNSLPYGPVERHGTFMGGIKQLENNNILVSGTYRSKYASYLNKYDTNTEDGNTAENIKYFDRVYDNTRAFTLSVYSSDLTLIDSLNPLSRTGQDAKYFERLYIRQPVTLDHQGNIYTCDNSTEYMINVFTCDHYTKENIIIENKEYKALPQPMSKQVLSRMRRQPGAYSQVYALFVKDSLILTSFFQSSAGRDSPQPPFYYDILTKNGRVLATGSLEYPFIAEDSGNRVYLLVSQPGSWLTADSLYLVGLTLEEIMLGKGSRKQLEQAIAVYEKKKR